MKILVRHITNFMHQWAPPKIKMDYDNVGLLVGDQQQEVERILVCLDVTEKIVDEAVSKGCQLIVSHHPLIFQKISRINPENEQGRILYKLIRNNIALFTAHTNLDAALDGVSFVLANNLGLDNLQFLERNYSVSRKITLTTAFEDSEAVLKLLNYYSAEEAHFFTVDGRKEGLKCFEAIMDAQNVDTLKKTLEREGLLKKGSFQVLKMDNPSSNFGMGVMGSYPDDGILKKEFLHLVCRALDISAIKFSGNADRVRRVAVCGGAGVFLKDAAVAAGADAYLTADIKYHEYFTEKKNFLLVDVGHYESEFPVVEAIRKELSEGFEELEILATKVVTNPVRIYSTEFENKTIE
ncbi:MAG: Nif3-like dinuclear metal center hexameric protein [Balneolaceae bacterium]